MEGDIKNIYGKVDFNKPLDVSSVHYVFPYDWFDSLNKLNETQLPFKEAFYSKLTDSHITDEDYKHAQKVWKEFGMKTFRELSTDNKDTKRMLNCMPMIFSS